MKFLNLNKLKNISRVVTGNLNLFSFQEITVLSVSEIQLVQNLDSTLPSPRFKNLDSIASPNLITYQATS